MSDQLWVAGHWLRVTLMREEGGGGCGSGKRGKRCGSRKKRKKREGERKERERKKIMQTDFGF